MMNLSGLLGQNQLTSSGLLLMAVGAILVYLKKIPDELLNWFLRTISMSVTVKDDDNAFGWVKEWFLLQDFTKKIRRVDLDSYTAQNKVGILPAPGTHWFWYKNRPYRLQYTRSEEAKGWSPKRQESFLFWTLGRNREVLEQFVNDIFMVHKNKLKGEPNLYVWTDNYWGRLQTYRQRILDSVILPKGNVEQIVHDIEWFLQAEDWYKGLGIPYHRGYLFYGIPGTGKSSLVSGLAEKFGMPIFLMSLGDMNDRTLMHAMLTVTPGSIVVLEDVDAMGRVRKQPQTNQSITPTQGQSSQGTPDGEESVKDLLGVTLSGLLNVLDGFKAPNGVMFIMTTNHMEKLDPALLRPGRVDYRLRFEMAKLEQKQELYKRFYPDKSEQDGIEFIMANRGNVQVGQTMADFQERLMGSYKQQKMNGNGKVTNVTIPVPQWQIPFASSAD